MILPLIFNHYINDSWNMGFFVMTQFSFFAELLKYNFKQFEEPLASFQLIMMLAPIIKSILVIKEELKMIKNHRTLSNETEPFIPHNE